MPFISSTVGSFAGGQRASTDSFSGLAKSNKIIVHYDPSDSTSYSGSGTTLTDLTSNNYNGTIVGGPTFDTNHFSLSANDYFVTPDISSDIPADDTHTVELWFYPTGDNGVLVQYQGQATPNTSYHFSGIEMVSGQLEFGLWNGSSLTSSGPTGAVSLNTWHQVVLSYDGSHIRGFLDGERVCKVAVTFDSPSDGAFAFADTGAFHLSVGADTITNQGDGSDFEGRVGIFRVYNAKLNRSAIRRNYLTDQNTHTAPANAWDPSTDITTVAWIDASDTSSYSTSGSTLTGVTDKSGTYTMTINGTPTVGSTLNGLNVFTFDGSNEYIQSTAYRSQVSNGNHWGIGVFRYDATNNTKNSFWSYETNLSPKRDYAVSSGASNNTWPGELDLDALSSNRISSVIGDKLEWTGLGGLNRSQWYIVACYFNKTGNQIGLRFDGRTNSFSPVNDYDNSIQTNQELRLMRNRSSVELNGKMAEFLAVADLPGTGGTDMSTIEKAEGYLAHKWGRTAALPSDHPYKNSAP